MFLVKIDAELVTDSLSDIPALARKAEEFGFDCVWANETKHDAFVQLALASLGTHTISLGSSIALAFTRSPMTIAYAAWDIQSVSRGRLILGLGSQVKGHIERRFSARWESPGPKMKETLQVLRSIWRSWQKGDRLDFQGRFFTMDLMTPFFSPGPIENPTIPIYVAGVNRGMCRLVGELGDGLHVHPLHTLRYLREVVLPSVSKGLDATERRREDVTIAGSVFAAVGDDESQIRKAKDYYRNQIAFYASTRTYRKVMELHGWGEVCDRLHESSMRRDWGKMGQEITEEILDEFVTQGTWKEVGSRIKDKYDGVLDRVRLYLPFDGNANWRSLVAGFRS
jgi:probable F420-dependent oxidoreductase